MSNTLYDTARYKMLTANFDWVAQDLRLAVWAGAPAFVAGDTVLNDLLLHHTPAGISLPILLPLVTEDGTAQSGSALVPTVPIGPQITWMTLINYDSVDQNQSELIEHIDEALVLPFTPNGLDMLISPDWLAQRGWFRP